MTVATILKSAQNFAHEILHPPGESGESYLDKSSQNSQTIHHHHYHHGYWGWYSEPIFVSGNSSSSSKKKDDNSFGSIVAIATIAILTSSYCIGSELGRKSNISVHRELLEDQRQMLKTAQEYGKERSLEVLEIEQKMLDTMDAQSSAGLMTKTLLLASGVAALAGAFFTSPVLVNAAALGGAISLSSTLVHWGYYDADTTVKENAVRLLNAIDRARDL